MKRSLLFIINPKAGKRLSDDISNFIYRNINNEVDYDIFHWDTLEKITQVPEILKNKNYTDVIAVGGDGTVNAVANILNSSNMAMGILPAGSGNGLARSLGIPINKSEACKCILEGKYKKIDSGKLNEKGFFCTAGTGFDAHIGLLFANSVKRGLQSYVKIILKELFSYKPQKYTIEIDGVRLERKAFLITVANAGQYGNNFYIAPEAKLNDGLFHLVIVHPFNFLQGIAIFLKILRKKAHTSKFIETFTAKNIIVEREEEGSVHCDGEPFLEEKRLTFTIENESLKVICGKNFNGL